MPTGARRTATPLFGQFLAQFYQITLRGGGGGGMVTDFSGTSILSNEFVVIGRASTDNLGVLLGPRAQCCPCGHRWLKKPKYERNEMKLRSFPIGLVAMS